VKWKEEIKEIERAGGWGGGFGFEGGVFWKPNLFLGPTFQWAVMDHFRFRSYLSF